MKLIPILAKAKAPDRALDSLIAGALNLPVPNDPAGWPPRYTASLDAARSIVPDDHIWLARLHSGKPNHDGEGRGKKGFANVYLPSEDGPMNDAYAHDPVIALCIAALKSRGVE